jgi:acetyl esterase/lipase
MLRLLFALLLLLLSLLTVFRAPTNFTWRVAVAVTEFPYIFFIVSLLLLVSCAWMEKYKIPAVLLSGLAFLLFCRPVSKTFERAANVELELDKEFIIQRRSAHLDAPFSFWKMFTGIGIVKTDYQTIAYKKLPEKELAFDYYKARSTDPAPCVIVIHGGSWAEGDSRQLPDLNDYLCSIGYNVAAINYRLAPKYQFPAPIEDTKDVIAYLSAHAAALNIDTTNFVLLGRSAGGQIALMTAYTASDPRIRGVISFYAPADMEWGARIKTNGWVLNTEKVLGDYVGCSVEQDANKYKACSAPEFVNAQTTPTLLIHGEIDAMVAFEHSTRLKKKLDQFNVKNYLLDLPTATHGCDYNINGPSGQLSTFVIERFINAVTSE